MVFHMKQAAFIGAGNMGGALIRAACQSVGGGAVVIANRTPAKADALAAELGCTAVQRNEDAVQGAQYIFLCVKPQLLRGVLKELTPCLRACHRRGEVKVLVSVAAGITTATLYADLAAEQLELPILRIMPNTPCAIGKGMVALCGTAGIREEYFSGLESILAQAGRIARIQESQMDAFSSVAGCGPAFVYQFIESLSDGGVMAGLPRAQAQTYAAQAVLGAAAMVLESGKHPGLLKDEVCSPGGSTIAGVAALERRSLRAAGMEAVAAAFSRNKELGNL